MKPRRDPWKAQHELAHSHERGIANQGWVLVAFQDRRGRRKRTSTPLSNRVGRVDGGAMRYFVTPLALIVATAGAFACGSSPAAPTDPAIPGPETTQLVAALQRKGATVELAEIMPQSSMPFFSVRALRESNRRLCRRHPCVRVHHLA
jgi:hypothetical protein